jgi:hypothetical protein
MLVASSSNHLGAASGMYWLLWGGSLVLSVVLALLLRTQWGHSRPLQKCALLSLLVHLLLAFLAMTVRIVTGDGGGGGGGGPPIRVRIVEEQTAAMAAVSLASSEPSEERRQPDAQRYPDQCERNGTRKQIDRRNGY